MKHCFLALVAVLATSCSSVGFVDHITIVNDTDYSAQVDITRRGSQRWLRLTFSEPHSRNRVESVIDQQDQWVFRFDYIGRHQEELEVTRAELERSDWRVEVPQSFEAKLRAMRIPPPRQ